MPFNYNDNFKEVDTLRPFKFWCNKVLPSVYDDSLSYYELLNKVVHYLNETMQNVNELNENFQKLKMVFEQLVNFINAFEEAINNRMDAQDAKIAKIEEDVDAFIQEMEQAFNDFTSEMKIYVEQIAKETTKKEVRDALASTEFEQMLDKKISDSIGENVGDNVEQILYDTTEIKTNLATCCSNLNEKTDTIQTTIGTKGDSQASATDGTVMGKLNLLIKAGSGSGSTDVNVQSIVDNIGNTDDSNGTQTTGTIFGKLNKIQESVAGTSTGEEQIATELSNLDSKMGSTVDTGGTQTTGSLFGKLNSCLQNLSSLLNFTQTNNTANESGTLSQKLSSIINFVKTNNTANSTGTLSQKLSYLINNSGSINQNTAHYMKVLGNVGMASKAGEVVEFECDINGHLYMAFRTSELPANWTKTVTFSLTLNDLLVTTHTLEISSGNFVPFEITPFGTVSGYIFVTTAGSASTYSFYFKQLTTGSPLQGDNVATLCGHMKLTITGLPVSSGEYLTFIQL